MSTIAKSFKIDDVLTNMTSVKLSDPTEAYGVRRTDTDAVVVADGTAMTNTSTGVYSYEFDDPADDLTYEYYLEVTYGGETYHIGGSFAGPTSAATRLTTLALAKTYLGVSGSDDDATIGGFLDAVTDAFEKYTGRHLVSATETEYLNGTGSRLIYTREPAESITTIHVDSARSWGAANLVSSDDYLQDGCQINHLDHIWSVGVRNVRIVYSAGFATIPDDIQQACKMQVNWLYTEWQRAKAGGANKAAMNVLGWNERYLQQKGLMPEVRAILDKCVPARL